MKQKVLFSKPESGQKFLFFILSMAIILFAGWTVSVHLAVLCKISWQYLKYGFLFLLPSLFILSFRVSVFAASLFHEETKTAQPTLQIPTDWRFFLILIIWCTLIIVFRIYEIRYILTSLFLIIMLFFKILFSNSNSINEQSLPVYINDKTDIKYLYILIAMAIAVTLFNHRPDLDDCNYLQIAISAIKYPTLPILSFDISLGRMINQLNFSPYLVSSYELYAAFVADFTRIDLLSVYYVLLPMVSAALTIIVAFLFCRWFLTTRASLLAVAIFFLICLSWGESHIAYGNRIFVRLFQGKSLLIPIITPAILLTGFLALRRPCLQSRILFLATIISGIGVSSSGLIIVLVVGFIAIISGIADMSRESIRNALFTFAMLAYPFVGGLIIKYLTMSNVAFSEISTILPINASLGSELREALALCIISIGAASLQIKRHHRTLFLFTLFMVTLTLSPFLAKFIASVSAGNMQWRLAWGAPIPLLMGIVFSGLIMQSLGQKKTFFVFFVFFAFLGFICADKWVFNKDNYIRLGNIGPTISPDYFTAKLIMEKINLLTEKPVVLATEKIAAWIPVTNPGTQIIMPGHSYPMMLKTILNEKDFKERMQLFSTLQGNLDLTHNTATNHVWLFTNFGVNVIIIRKNSERDLRWVQILSSCGITPKFRFDEDEYASFVY